MKCYYHPEVTAITTCPDCQHAICEKCYCKDDGKPVCRHCLKIKASITKSPGNSVKIAVTALIVITIFAAGVLINQSLVNTDRKLPVPFNETSSLNLWIAHTILSLDEMQRQSNETQVQSKKTQVNLEAKSAYDKIKYLLPFDSLSELRRFLETDQTDKQKYSRDFDCDDFSFMLSQNAMNEGYQIFPFAEGNHLKNMAHVSLGSSAVAVYVVEPQTDEIRLWGRVD